MKKHARVFALLLVVVLALSFAGCGAGKNSSTPAAAQGVEYAYGSAADYDYAAPAEAPMPATAESAAYNDVYEAGLGARGGELSAAANMSEKIIYNADIRLETTEFDETLEKLGDMIAQAGGYIESSSVSGSNYANISRGTAGARGASYTIRIPSDRFNAFTGGLSALGNIPSSYTYTQNITTQYYDVQSRLEAYKVQEKRLLEMLSIAETVEDMLAIQRELTNVQYEIDSATGTLRYYDDQVGYSTVDLRVQEVKEYTPESTIQLGYWERMSRGFWRSMEKTGNFFKEFFLWLVTSLPWLIPLIVVLIIVIALLRHRLRRNPERARRRQEKKEKKALRRAQRKEKKTALPASQDESEDKSE